MKCRIIIDKRREEEILIYVHEKTKLTEQIEKLVSESDFELVGHKDKIAVKINPVDVFCFSVEDNKIYALTENEKLQLKLRLYRIEENLNDSFVKINQSCIANIKKIAKFDTSVSGTMKVVFKNGYTDYVSRRNLKNIKERLGI